MPLAHANGIDIYYEIDGPDDGPPLLLVNGFTSQLNSWTPQFVEAIVDAGFRLVRYDNRDVGLTTKSDGEPPAYTVVDMATDGISLLHELGIEAAHVVGASMGGMIVQHMAFGHPDSVLTMTSIMSTTGDTSITGTTPEAMELLLSPPPADRDGYLADALKKWKVFAAEYYDEARFTKRAADAYDRMYYPRGSAFQMAAIIGDGDRTERLSGVRCPALVIHGAADPLVPLACGEDTARTIPGADLVVIEEMGHALPISCWPRIIDAVATHTARH